jgi:tetratricopeptide (TPR) repeat protein
MARRLSQLAFFVLIASCAAPRANMLSPQAGTSLAVPNQIFGTHVEGTAKELLARAERELLARRWKNAIEAFEAAIAGDTSASDDPQTLYDLALAYEGAGAREKARARYHELSARFPSDPNARNARVREVSLDAYLEDWRALGDLAEIILGVADQDAANVLLGLGARALTKIEERDESAAARAVKRGLEILDETQYGASGQLPVAVAMLHYADGEVRNFRSAKISLNPPGPDFLQKLEARCALLLEAQSAYANAIRSVDPQWAAMSGYRVGEMYRALHHDLMQIPPNDKAKTDHDKQLFYAIMHVRYRVLLEKGREMMKRTLALGEKTGAAPAWTNRAETLASDIDKALDAERATLATFPFSEAEIQKAIEILQKKGTQKDRLKPGPPQP